MQHMIGRIAGVSALCVLAACSTTPELPVMSKEQKVVQQRYIKKFPKGSIKIGKPYAIAGKAYLPAYQPGYDKKGIASWYGPNFHGQPTANGEIFNQYAMTAAHTTLPMPSIVRVTNLENGRAVKVRINDRGPFAHNRIIDLSKAAAEKLDMIRNGTARVRVTLLEKETHRYISRHYDPLEAQRMAAIATAAGGNIDDIKQPDMQHGDVIIGQIRQHGQPKMVLNPLSFAAPKPEAEQFIVSGGGEDFAVQAGAFRDHGNAQIFAARLASYGASYVESNGSWHRVRLGPFADRHSAERILSYLQQDGYNASIVLANAQ